MPVTESLLRKTAMLIRSPPPDVPLRAGDAIRDRFRDGRDGNLDQRSSSARGGRPFRPRRAQFRYN
jgi:hypothetical protein